MFHEYEIVFIIRPDLDDADTNAAIEKVETALSETGGTLLDRDDWGKRKLAYLIEKHAKGHYVLLAAVSAPDAILEIERRMRLDDRFIRFLTVKVADAVDIDARREETAKVRAEREEARARAAAEAEANGSNDDDNDNDDDASAASAD